MCGSAHRELPQSLGAATSTRCHPGHTLVRFAVRPARQPRISRAWRNEPGGRRPGRACAQGKRLHVFFCRRPDDDYPPPHIDPRLHILRPRCHFRGLRGELRRGRDGMVRLLAALLSRHSRDRPLRGSTLKGLFLSLAPGSITQYMCSQLYQRLTQFLKLS